ncbi:MAG: anti-sigma F factor antagonist [Clostridium sp.]|uniref:anti-sigma F factor antagonist n=1 Tax=Clostridium sp. TaxID=1506 RepID=UPI002FC89C13
MYINFDRHDSTLVTTLVGELDHHNAEIVRIKIDNKIEELGSQNIVFDFNGVNFMDSSGIGVVMGRFRKLSATGGKACVVNLKPNIKRVFELSGLFKIIPEHSDIETAVSSL